MFCCSRDTAPPRLQLGSFFASFEPPRPLTVSADSALAVTDRERSRSPTVRSRSLTVSAHGQLGAVCCGPDPELRFVKTIIFRELIFGIMIAFCVLHSLFQK